MRNMFAFRLMINKTSVKVTLSDYAKKLCPGDLAIDCKDYSL